MPDDVVPNATTEAAAPFPGSVTAELDGLLARLSEPIVPTAISLSLEEEATFAIAVAADDADATDAAADGDEWDSFDVDEDALRQEVRDLLSGDSDQPGDGAALSPLSTPMPLPVLPVAETPSVAGLRQLIVQQLRGRSIGDAVIADYARLIGITAEDLHVIRERVRGRAQAADLLAEIDREQAEQRSAQAALDDAIRERQELWDRQSAEIDRLTEAVPVIEDNSEVRRQCATYLHNSAWPDDLAALDQLTQQMIEIGNDLSVGLNATRRAALQSDLQRLERQQLEILMRP